MNKIIISSIISFGLIILCTSCGYLKSKTTTKINDKLTVNEFGDAEIIVSSYPFFPINNDIEEVKEEGENKSGIFFNGDMLRTGPKPVELGLPNGNKITIPANSYYMIKSNWNKKSNQITFTDIIESIKQIQNDEHLKTYLIFGGLGIVVLFGLAGWFTRQYGLILLGVLLGTCTYGIAFYPIVSLVMIGILCISTIVYVIYEMRKKSTYKTLYIKDEEKIVKLENEIKTLRSFMNGEDLAKLDAKLQK